MSYSRNSYTMNYFMNYIINQLNDRGNLFVYVGWFHGFQSEEI